MKKTFILMLTIGTMLSMLAGCGDKEPTMAEDGSVQLETVTEETQSISTEETSSVEATEAPETEEVASEETSTQEPEVQKTWFEEQGLTITPQGAFTFTTTSCDYNLTQDLETFPVKADVTITETTEGCADGYKKVVSTFGFDWSADPNDACYVYFAAFDRYTGTYFGADTDTRSVTINNGDKIYDIAITSEVVGNYPSGTCTFTVTVPQDYDGMIFQAGNWSVALEKQDELIDYDARLYTIDELPAYGDGYYYFSYTNE